MVMAGYAPDVRGIEKTGNGHIGKEINPLFQKGG